MTHPYSEFEGTKSWKVIDAAIADLEENQDLEITTVREYVVGYLTKKVVDEMKRSVDKNLNDTNPEQTD